MNITIVTSAKTDAEAKALLAKFNMPFRKQSEGYMAKKSLIIKAAREQKYETRQYNRCQLCGRPRGYLRKYKMCRICFRKLASEGLLPGVTKSSWQSGRRIEMSASDPVADMLTKVRNAANARHEKVDIPASKLKLEIVKILKTEGYIKNFKKVQEEGHSIIRIILKYDDSNNPVIHGAKKISTPGRRVYSGYKDLPRVFNGYGTIIVSTSAGVTTGKKASEKMVGGELICSIW